MLSPEKLFQSLHKSEWPRVFTLYSRDEYLYRELRDAIRKAGFDLQRKDMKKKGPESSDEDLSCSTSLFQSRTFVWLETQAAPDRWSADSKKVWDRMVGRCDGESLVMCLNVSSAPSAKSGGAKKKPTSAKSGTMDLGEEFLFEVAPSAHLLWLKRMNRERGNSLDEKRLNFLSHLDTDLANLDQYVELWSLGGDTWAQIALSYGELDSSTSPNFANVNPAYAWVDALLEGNSSKALVMLQELLRKGQDPLPLLGLVSKTLKIWAYLEKGVTPQGEAPFLIDKVKRAMRQRSSSSLEVGGIKLGLAAKMDVLLKTRPVDAEALLVQLSSH